MLFLLMPFLSAARPTVAELYNLHCTSELTCLRLLLQPRHQLLQVGNIKRMAIIVLPVHLLALAAKAIQ